MYRSDPTQVREATTPERRLVAAIIKQSIDDLTHHDARIRGEARAFWTARFGPVAAHRKSLLTTLDFDDDLARARIAHMLRDEHVREQAVRGAVPIYMRLLRLIPDGEHTITAIKALDPSLSENSANTAVKSLKEKDLIRCTTTRRGGSLWARTDYLISEALKPAAA